MQVALTSDIMPCVTKLRRMHSAPGLKNVCAGFFESKNFGVCVCMTPFRIYKTDRSTPRLGTRKTGAECAYPALTFLPNRLGGSGWGGSWGDGLHRGRWESRYRCPNKSSKVCWYYSKPVPKVRACIPVLRCLENSSLLWYLSKTSLVLFSHGRVCGIEGVVAHICPLFEFATVLASGKLKEGSMRWNSDNRTGWDTLLAF